ncbi:unnamed protein product [Urochloa humidicola]
MSTPILRQNRAKSSRIKLRLMASVMISFKATALVAALLSVVVTHGGVHAEPSYNETIARRELYLSPGSTPSTTWRPARATWYGRSNGAGPDNNGGGCGYSNTNQYPFNSMTSCGNQPLFLDGKGLRRMLPDKVHQQG